MINVLLRVFGHLSYTLVAGVIAVTLIISTILLPNRTSIGQVLSSDVVSLVDKSAYVFSLLGSLFTNFTTASAIYLFVVAILFGINISLLTFYIRKRQVASKNKKVHLTSLGGFTSAVLGIGCAACGSIVLSALLSTFGAGTLIVMLPLHGLEFGLVGIILLLFSNRYLIKRIEDPLICPAY